MVSGSGIFKMVSLEKGKCMEAFKDGKWMVVSGLRISRMVSGSGIFNLVSLGNGSCGNFHLFPNKGLHFLSFHHLI
jgi:hypothetical protein